MPVDFKLTIPLAKSERTDGWYITGIAAGTDPDLEQDVLTERCIKGFADQINTSPVPFRNWHNVNSITSEMGDVVKAWIENGSQLGVEVKLDEDNPDAQYLWSKLNKGKQFGMSVEGGIQKYEYNSARKSSNGRVGRDIDEVILREISATTKPVYTPSFGTVLRKAIDEAEAASVARGDTSNMDPLVQTGETVQTTPAPEAVAPTVTPDAAEVTKAVSADTARDAKKLTKLVQMHRDMAALITDLGLDDGAIAAPETAVSTTTVDTAKSQAGVATSADIATLVKSFEETTASFKAEIESLRELIPATAGPGVLITKSESEELADVIADLKSDPRRALRFGLAAARGETYNG